MRSSYLIIGILFVSSSFTAMGSSMPMGHDSMQTMPGMDHGQDGMAVSMLSSSDPADGASLDAAPRTLSLTFKHPVLLKTVLVAGPGEAKVAATFRRPTSATSAYSIALSDLTSGEYTVNWTATGMGHSMQGSLRFSVQ